MRFPRHKKWVTLACGAIIVFAAAFFLMVSRNRYGLGFPLDDAWIHQTYARNLGQNGEWAFLPGESSAGSTGPLWSGLLSLGYLLNIPYKVWTYCLGSLALIAIALIAGDWFKFRNPKSSSWRWVVIAVVGLEWHLLWSALSGMETIAIALVNVTVLYAVERPDVRGPYIGLLIGIGFWLRPEAILLLLPVLWMVFFSGEVGLRTRIIKIAGIGAAFMVLVVPYLWLNNLLVGQIWPTTFFAKQAEYAFLRQTPLTSRLLNQVSPPLTGAGIVLVPGMILVLADILRHRRWKMLAPFVWSAAFLGTYALRLPVNYQHGRYAMPVIPVLLVMGFSGMAGWAQLNAAETLHRIVARVWVGVMAVVALGFVFIGANAYATDVAIIETEMVAASQWIRDNTSPQALIAAHDIGALGYFGERRILDLAGLISPEVIPILRDEPALIELLNDEDVDYLMTFPGWYPEMTAGLPVVFKSGGTFSPSIDGENMTVYDWISE